MCIAWAINPISSVFSALCLLLGHSSVPFLWAYLQIVSAASQSCCSPPSSLLSFSRRVRLSPPLFGCCPVPSCRGSSPLLIVSPTCHSLPKVRRRDNVRAYSP